jgi:hypothetical protein
MKNIHEFAILVFAAVVINIVFAFLLLALTTDDDFQYTMPPKHKTWLDRYFSLFYFSLTTFTTMEYGDILPASNRLRLIMMIYQVCIFAGLVSILFDL